MQDIEALTKRILLIGKGRILLDGSLEALLEKHTRDRTLTLRFSGAFPEELPPGLTQQERQSGRIVLKADTDILPVSQAVAWLSARTELADLAVSDSEKMKASAASYSFVTEALTRLWNSLQNH